MSRDQAIAAMDALVAAGFSVTLSAGPAPGGYGKVHVSYGLEIQPPDSLRALRHVTQIADAHDLGLAFPAGPVRLWPKDDLS